MKRNTFLKKSLALGTFAAVSNYTLAFGPSVYGLNAPEGLFLRVIAANDKKVSDLLAISGENNESHYRRIGEDFAQLAASYSTPFSKHYRSETLLSAMDRMIQLLSENQHEDGTMNFGNLQSPPDTAFLLEYVCAATSIILKDNSDALGGIKPKLKKFITRAAESLVTGGVHTANHRWVVSAALAQINALYPDQKYINRIDDWLGEGVFIDNDGHFQERSRNYSVVIDRALITMGSLLDRPFLFDPVRKNLGMTYYYMDPNGDLVTNDSRRQDQFSSKSMVSYYLCYRYMAINDNDLKLGSIAKIIETLPGFEEQIVNEALVHFLYQPILQKKLRYGVEPPVVYETFFKTTHLARIRNGQRTATIFGGVDWPLIIASGRSTSPNFFAFRKGEAILEYMRMSAAFFSTGYFRSEGLQKEGDQYILHNKFEAPYYQPLPKDKRNDDGEYELSRSVDGRFWNKMDFENRPISNVKTIDYRVAFQTTREGMELSFSITGAENVPVTIEMCFKEGGTFEGLTAENDDSVSMGQNHFLEEGMGTYSYGDSIIRFGPGSKAHTRISRLDGEMYSSHFGSLRTPGMFAYITGKTPFEHTLTLS